MILSNNFDRRYSARRDEFLIVNTEISEKADAKERENLSIAYGMVCET
jgi:hypothetical protein